ncbi:MAG: sortase, partial [Anaerolineae bacterium]|nr:sortase [Anaerolineae bacterium]
VIGSLTLIAVGLILILFRRQLIGTTVQSIWKSLSTILILCGVIGLVSITSLGLLWTSQTATPASTETTTVAQVSTQFFTAVEPTITPVPTVTIPIEPPAEEPEQAAAEVDVDVALASWAEQFRKPEVPATRVVIPALGIDTDLTEAPISGNTWDVNRFTDEIAHLEGTAHLGTMGNAVLAGHITHQAGYGPFQHLDQMEEGDIILAYGEGVEYRYMVKMIRYADPSEIEYTLPLEEDGKYITLITCADWDQSSRRYLQRLIVRAEAIS